MDHVGVDLLYLVLVCGLIFVECVVRMSQNEYLLSTPL